MIEYPFILICTVIYTDTMEQWESNQSQSPTQALIPIYVCMCLAFKVLSGCISENYAIAISISVGCGTSQSRSAMKRALSFGIGVLHNR